MQTFKFYADEGFKLFRCNIDKTPDVSTSWKFPQEHIDADQADQTALRGGYIGAWLPENYVVIDIDRGHGSGDGMPTFLSLCEDLGIEYPETRTVKTGSGGLHLYFTTPPGTDHETLSQKKLAPDVDIRTHAGYVIAAGTNGYTLIKDVSPIEIPPSLLQLIQKKNEEKAEPFHPEKELPIEIFQRVLEKVPVEEFGNNDDWQEFVTSCIATAGNSPEVLDLIEAWSRSDDNYRNDPYIRKRLETFEPAGGITVGTFLHVLKNVGVSRYMIDKVRMFVGAEFSLGNRFIEAFEPPFEINYSVLSELEEEAGAYYYQKSQSAATRVFVRLVKDSLYYVVAERSFFYFNGSRWVEEKGILEIIFSVIISAMQRYYTDYSKPKDADADEYLNSCLNYTSAYAILTKLEHALKQHPDIWVNSLPWDSPDIAATLTLKDCVMDFSGPVGEIIFRPGRREEYRRLYLDLTKEDFNNKELPHNFRAFLKDVFPDDETRKTATYALATMVSGTGRFRKFQLWNGAGSNGKSTLMEIIKELIGERAITYKPDVLLNKSHTQSLTPELAVFRGALVAFSSETEEAKRISQGQVKVLTGNETVVANPKYKDVIEFKTTFQLVLATNYLPTFSAHDAAFIDRLLVLPFYTCFYKTEEQRERAQRMGSRYFVEARNPEEIMEAVRSERAQVLYYLASRYQEMGNDIPESEQTLEVKRHYVEENNDIFQFIDDFIEFDITRDFFTPTRDLVEFYNEENNTKFSSKYVIMRLREVYPKIQTHAKMINGKYTRGLKYIRLKYGAYPEGYQGNYTQAERGEFELREVQF